MHSLHLPALRDRAPRAAVIGVATLLAALLPLPAQAPDEAPAEELAALTFGETVSVGLVLVPAVVRSRGGYVRGLDPDDFELEVDGRPVPIQTFERNASAPLSLIFLQDLSGSMANAGKLEASREVVGFFLDRARPGDEIAIATFADGGVQVEIPFTSDFEAAREAIEVWEGYGMTSLHDAVAWLPELSAEGQKAKRAAVLLTDGVDNASSLAPHLAREIVRRAQLPVYVLGIDSGDAYEVGPEGKLHRYADVLNLLAHFSGGRYFALASPADWKEAVIEVAADLRNQYVLGFAPSGWGPVESRSIEVRVRGRQRNVLARTSYHGTRPAELAPKD